MLPRFVRSCNWFSGKTHGVLKVADALHNRVKFATELTETTEKKRDSLCSLWLISENCAMDFKNTLRKDREGSHPVPSPAGTGRTPPLA